MEIETKNRNHEEALPENFRAHRFTLQIGVILLLSLGMSGCFATKFLGPDPRAPEQLKLKQQQLVANQELTDFLKETLHAILSDPSNISTLRGTNASVTLVSIPAPNEEGVRGRSRIGHVNGGTRMNPGGMIGIPLAAYYFAHPNSLGYRADALIERRVRAMLGDGGPSTVNAAIDSVTQTESGPPLEGAEFEEFAAKRDIVNRWLAALGLRPPLKVNQKIWNTQPFGRDIQLLGNNYNNSNIATTEALARLLYLEAGGYVDKGTETPALLQAMADAPKSETAPVSLAAKAWPGSNAVYSYATDHGDMYGEAAIVEWADGNKMVLVFMSDRARAGREISRTLIAKLAEKYPGGVQ